MGGIDRRGRKASDADSWRVSVRTICVPLLGEDLFGDRKPSLAAKNRRESQRQLVLRDARDWKKAPDYRTQSPAVETDENREHTLSTFTKYQGLHNARNWLLVPPQFSEL